MQMFPDLTVFLRTFLKDLLTPNAYPGPPGGQEVHVRDVSALGEAT